MAALAMRPPVHENTANAHAPPNAPSRRATDPGTIGGDLERQRLEVRAHRVERVLAILRGRAAAATERAALHRAIRDFERELEQLRERLPTSRDGLSHSR
jgi:hypothetical protein